MTTTYTCPRGCCVVHVGAFIARGTPLEVYVNGERGTYASLATKFGCSAIRVYHRIQNRHCLTESAAEISARRVKRRIHRLRAKPSGLVNRFLMTMAAPVKREPI
ncbi:MAG TPA: hypothetical protein VJA26_11600 [Gammaproteobacteria bacterium]|nr:hypothetical protein [Gammaproteobacteria bacterium]